ncbi:hypothetical protein [Lactococcus lactis]|uniref:hypothetical protein n=1 Tax=Lactococcus lactis TaxID=1358 RepID=UPI001F576790|nr:hypothetical protein [Lactococcus lactis]
MYNQKKIKWFKRVSFSALVFLMVLVVGGIGFTLGMRGKQKAIQQVKKPKVAVNTKQLSDATVNKFLVAYYTKKDLGENDNRYQPLMTEQMYHQSISEEKLPVNQAYKGYVIDQVFDRADIYINQKDLTAICNVTYKNTQLLKLHSKEGALYDQSSKVTIRLTFLKQGKKYLVNRLEWITLVEPDGSSSANSYKKAPTVPSSSSSRKESSQVEER